MIFSSDCFYLQFIDEYPNIIEHPHSPESEDESLVTIHNRVMNSIHISETPTVGALSFSVVPNPSVELESLTVGAANHEHPQ